MTNFDKHTDEALMGLLQNGSNSAFDEIYARYSKKLLAFIYRMVNGAEALAQDVLHDVFLKIIEKPNAFDVTRSFKPWIYQVAANASRKSYRMTETEEVKESHTQFLGNSHQPNLADRKAFDNSLNTALNKLSIEHREVFVLKHQQYMSIKEISIITNIPEGTVKSRLHTATKHLAKSLRQFNPKETA
ncbi:MAG: RNA polymerase sigma factor [Bacteroidia bacterium]